MHCPRLSNLQSHALALLDQEAIAPCDYLEFYPQSNFTRESHRLFAHETAQTRRQMTALKP